MRKRNKTHTKESLLALCHQDGDCLVWDGLKRSNGYGIVAFRSMQTSPHRAMYQLVFGEIPAGMEIDHVCNQRACINPDHLRLVTHAENMKLGADRRKTCRSGHPWTESNTYIATVKRKQGGTRTQRYCRLCRAQHQKDIRSRIKNLLTGVNQKGGIVK